MDRLAPRTLKILVSLAGLLLPFQGPAHSASMKGDSPRARDSRHFTVRDSVEMSRFNEVNSAPVISPNGRYAAAVTSRGVIATNSVESTLWLFDIHSVERALQSDYSGKTSQPRIVARMIATPRAIYYASYEPVISSVRWMGDSQTLLFLAQASSGKHRLYEVQLAHDRLRLVTPPDRDVTQFDFAAGTFVYRTEEEPTNPQLGDRINADAWDITGMPLSSVLFRKTVTGYSTTISTLWVNRKNHNHPIVPPSSSAPLRLANSPPTIRNVLSISPDGRTAVALMPVQEVRKSWELYVPAYSNLAIRIGDSNAASVSVLQKLTEYTAIDLQTGQTRAMVSAPNGWSLGYSDQNRVVWSADARTLLLTNTYLPLEEANGPEKAQRTRPCVAAVTDFVSGATTCVSYDRAGSLSDASFGQTSAEVQLWFFGSEHPKRYRLLNGSWQLEPQNSDQAPVSPSGCFVLHQRPTLSASIYVSQDLNKLPTLWARNCETGQEAKIWDPNPQLAKLNLGEATAIHWKDGTGHVWGGALLLPPDYVEGKRYPLVIQTYGFEENEFLSDGEFTTAFAARPLAAAGIVVLAIMERGDEFDTAQEASDQVLGFESAIDKLARDGLIDRQRVGIIGFSRTSYYVESALIKDPDEFAAATIADGVDESYMQYLLFFSVGSDYRTEADRIYGAAPFGEGLKKWLDAAPGFHINRIHAPVRIEAIGPLSVLTEWELYSSLWRQGKPVDFVYIPGGQHILQKPLDRMASQQGDVDWFRFWLENEEDSDPSKALQYRRWREIRTKNASHANAVEGIGPSVGVRSAKRRVVVEVSNK